MLRDLMREYTAASTGSPTKAHHLADAVIDLCVMIQRTETNRQPKDSAPPDIRQ
jgi:hypothetical protein